MEQSPGGETRGRDLEQSPGGDTKIRAKKQTPGGKTWSRHQDSFRLGAIKSSSVSTQDYKSSKNRDPPNYEIIIITN